MDAGVSSTSRMCTILLAEQLFSACLLMISTTTALRAVSESASTPPWAWLWWLRGNDKTTILLSPGSSSLASIRNAAFISQALAKYPKILISLSRAFQNHQRKFHLTLGWFRRYLRACTVLYRHSTFPSYVLRVGNPYRVGLIILVTIHRTCDEVRVRVLKLLKVESNKQTGYK